MRVITGSARGAKLKTLEGLATRPTSDRVKEAIFNIIQFDIEGRRVLDLFGGSGQLAIEALSRGADYAVLVDQSAEAVKVIKDNLKKGKIRPEGVGIPDGLSPLSLHQPGEIRHHLPGPPLCRKISGKCAAKDIGN